MQRNGFIKMLRFYLLKRIRNIFRWKSLNEIQTAYYPTRIEKKKVKKCLQTLILSRMSRVFMGIWYGRVFGDKASFTMHHHSKFRRMPMFLVIKLIGCVYLTTLLLKNNAPFFLFSICYFFNQQLTTLFQFMYFI